MIVQTKIGMIDDTKLEISVSREKIPCGIGVATEYRYNGAVVRMDYRVEVDTTILCTTYTGSTDSSLLGRIKRWFGK